MASDLPIGFFDSGVGGVSVLREARALLPQEHFIFYGDNAHAPYGSKSEEEIRALTWDAVQILLAQNIKALVIACNTATSAAAASLRQALTLPVIGMEPALKPATQLRHGGIVLVLATPRTLSLPKFQQLMQRYGEDAIPVPCPGLVEFVERGVLKGEALYRFLEGLLKPYLNRQVDAVVLGCTHYIFVRDTIAALFPPSTLVIDGNEGTVRQLRRVLLERGLLRAEGEGSAVFQTSGNPRVILPLMESLLSWQAEECVLPLSP